MREPPQISFQFKIRFFNFFSQSISIFVNGTSLLYGCLWYNEISISKLWIFVKCRVKVNHKIPRVLYIFGFEAVHKCGCGIWNLQ